jgi:sugar phosphate isomerase/epimerase
MTRLTASTLGAPDDDLDTVVAALGRSHVTSVELRVSSGQIVDPAMTGRALADVRSRFDAAGISVSGLAGYVRVASDAGDEMVVGALAEALRFAAVLGAPVVRVFPGAPIHPSDYASVPELREEQGVVDDRAARRIDAVATLATDLDVYPVLETHDSHPRGADILRVLERVTGPVGAVWDLMHPWRVGESLETTWSLLEPWIAHDRGSVQVKDADLPGDPTPVAIGRGTVPTDEFGALLRAADFDGTVCLEWERTWYPAVPPLGDALVSARAWFDRYFEEGH